MLDLEKIREQIHTLKPKSFADLEGDHSNLDDVLNDYRIIHKVARDLLKLEAKTLGEALITQPSEYHFFRMCAVKLKAIMDYYDSLIKHERGKIAVSIRGNVPRDLNERSITTIIDADDYIFQLTTNLLKVKECHEQFIGTLESYNQRGYALNNITKAKEILALDDLL